MASISAGMLLNFSGQKYRIRACQKTFCHRIIKAVALSRYNLHHACCPEPVLLGYHLLLPALVSMQHRRIPGISRKNTLSGIVSTSDITGLSDRQYAISSLLKSSIFRERYSFSPLTSNSVTSLPYLSLALLVVKSRCRRLGAISPT